MKTISVKVRKNMYGNFRGRVTGQDWFLIGSSEFDALEWASQALANNPGATLNPLSYFPMVDIERHRNELART